MPEYIRMVKILLSDDQIYYLPSGRYSVRSIISPRLDTMWLCQIDLLNYLMARYYMSYIKYRTLFCVLGSTLSSHSIFRSASTNGCWLFSDEWPHNNSNNTGSTFEYYLLITVFVTCFLNYWPFVIVYMTVYILL